MHTHQGYNVCERLRQVDEILNDFRELTLLCSARVTCQDVPPLLSPLLPSPLLHYLHPLCTATHPSALLRTHPFTSPPPSPLSPPLPSSPLLSSSLLSFPLLS